MAAPATYERLRSNGYPWKRVKDDHKNGRPKVSPDSFQYALRYTLDGNRQFHTFKTVDELMVAKGRVEVQLRASKNGVQVLNPLAARRREKQETLASAVQRYTDEVKANKAHRTWTAYRNSLRHFLASCDKRTVQQVTREDLLALKVYCKNVKKHANGTVYNNFLNTMVFFIHRTRPQSSYRVVMIGQGFCFNGGEWNFPDAPLRGIYRDRSVYRGVTDLESFDPWLTTLESSISPDVLWAAADGVSPEWYGDDGATLERLLHRLDRGRRSI